ncbi:MAG: serine/threonine-protein kinase [Planctomycetaceae bacterium]|nr:serine/threonine-protein kinase [Planctomycetaceae bacterium]
MLEPPTPELQRRLRDWRLCRPADLRRARRRVRQLARDLPAFDSVWIDALVQDGRLTPFQARVLESDEPQALAAGDYVLLDELGRSRGSRTWLARSLSSGTPCVVKRVVTQPERKADLITRGRQLASSAAGLTASDLIAPTSCWDDATGCYFVMPFVAGTPLSELLVRRGRFPADIVAEIGRQLAAALDGWHHGGQVHGDIRLSHVRITSRGQAVLVEAGLRPVIEPDVTLHTSLSLEAYDGIAPELIGIGHTPTAASDLYALGCLLWQLLAGRPPFTMADPLAKLAAHQTRSIPDVREWAPETPTALAELIATLTHRDPQQRPASAAEVVQRLQRLGTPGRSAVRTFRQRFDVSVPHLRPQRSSDWPRWTTVAAVLFVMGGSIASLTDRGVRTELLSLAGRKPQPTENVAPPIDATSGLLPLPNPAADGVLLLNQPGPYAASIVRYAGRLQIKGDAGVCPVILIRDEPLQLAAESVTFDRVTVRHDVLWPTEHHPAALVSIQAQQVTVTASAIDTGLVHRGRDERDIPAGIAWKLIDPLDPAAGSLTLRDALFRGAGTAIVSHAAARRIAADDVLWQGRGAAFELRLSDDEPVTNLRLDHITVRDSRTFLRCVLPQTESLSPRLAVTATDCVLGLDGSLLQFGGETTPMLGPESVVWDGEGNLFPPDKPIATWRGASSDPTTVLPTDDWPLEGLTAGRFTFAGPSTGTVADSILADAEAPRRSPEPPGVRLSRFDACHGGISAEDTSLPPNTFNRGP